MFVHFYSDELKVNSNVKCEMVMALRCPVAHRQVGDGMYRVRYVGLWKREEHAYESGMGKIGYLLAEEEEKKEEAEDEKKENNNGGREISVT